MTSGRQGIGRGVEDEVGAGVGVGGGVGTGVGDGVGPRERTIFTWPPLGQSTPAAGSVRMTVPASAAELSCVTLPRVRPAASRVLLASSRVWPRSDGTLTFSWPLLTWTVTVSPRFTCVPAAGSVLIT